MSADAHPADETAGPAVAHRAATTRFGAVVAGVGDWDAPTPVAAWRARDVVDHLVTWLPGFLAGAGVAFDAVEPAGPDGDPAAVWRAHAGAVQTLLDDPARAGASCTTPMFGEVAVATIVDRIYTGDVVFHTWDLARASGQPHGLDDAWCLTALAAMEPMDAVLRDSGQFGPRQPVADDAAGVDRLMAFLGRDPGWQPPG